MNHFYKFLLVFFYTIFSHAQLTPTNIYVDKAWVTDGEEWMSYKYEGKIVVSTTSNEGNIRITNYDFLRDFCNGRAKFSDKSSYTTATFESTRKISAQKDKQGIINSTYEGVLVFQSGSDYYSVLAVITLLEKGYIVGMKMRDKNNNKEYAFSFLLNS